MTRFTKKLTFIAFLFSAFGGYIAFAQEADPDERIDALESKVEEINNNMSQILALLQAQQQKPEAAQPEPTPAVTEPPAAASPAATKMVPGVALEVWGLPKDYNADFLPGRAMGGFVDDGPSFHLSNFWTDPDYAQLKNSPVGLKWSGFFKAEKQGVYTFAIVMEKAQHDEGIISYDMWHTKLLISENPIISQSNRIPGGLKWGSADQYLIQQKAWTASGSESVELAPGYYPIELMTHFTYEGDAHVGPTANFNDYKPFKITLRVRGPSDLKPTVLSGSTLFLKE